MELDLQAVAQLPTDDITRVPIQHGDQVEPARDKSDVRNVDAPDVVRCGSGDATQQVRINAVRQLASAQVRPRTDGHDAHFTHVSLDGLAVNAQALALQADLNSTWKCNFEIGR